MSTIYLMQYNNYYNRTVKYKNSLADYLTAVPEINRRKIENINFFYNDQVNTTQTINYAAPAQIPEKQYDYLLVDHEDYGLSRWFIIECRWNRKGQQILTLRRDLLVDFMANYLTQPLYAEKGVVNTYTYAWSPLISNPETVQTSQILYSTHNIGGSDSIVGYIDRSYAGNSIAQDINCIYVNSLDELGITEYIGQTLYEFKTGSSRKLNWIVDTSTDNTLSDGAEYHETLNAGSSTQGSYDQLYDIYSNWGSNGDESDNWGWTHSVINGIAGTLYNDLNAQIGEAWSKVAPFAGRNIMIGNDLYTLKVTNSDNSTSMNRNYRLSSSAFLTLQSACAPSNIKYKGDTLNSILGARVNIGDNCVWYSTTVCPHKVTLEPNTTTGTIQLSDIGTRAHCGQPYDIFYMADSTKARNIASCIAARLYSSGALYDLQLLPYAPNTTSATSQTVTYGTGAGVTLYWLAYTNATSSITIDHSASPGSGAPFKYSSVIDGKIGCLCDTVRICSPNHANSWDFNPAQNGGIDKWYIRMTCKPFQPYIHIRPDFKWMYSQKNDYGDDPRGLICGGSFSFPFVNDKWANYQMNNSAYYNAFERDIDNLSTTQKYERVRDVTNIVTGTAQGVATGMGLGNYLSGGNTGATVAGGIGGGVASLIGGIADYQINENLRNEAMDYRKDMFGFNTKNIIASPRTLARTSSFDVDWHGPAYIEYYTASDGEKEAVKNKLKYNGWSLNVVVSSANTNWFTNGIKTLLNNARTGQSNYVKGRLIYTTQYDDTHVFNELANEWFKGFYWDTSNGELS